MKKISFLFSFLLGTISLSAQLWTQVGSDIDEEGNAVSLSASGTRIAIGTYLAFSNSGTGGRVRVYEESAGVWSQLGGDIDAEAFFDWFGIAVSMSDDGLRVAIGAALNDGNGIESGSVRVYEENGGTWKKVGGDIDGEYADDRFGTAISMSFDGRRVAIGSIRNDDNGTDAGHVRVYKQTGNKWIQVGSDLDGEGADNYFGSSVSLSDDGMTLAIGARRNSGNGAQAGHVRVYRESGGVWTQLGTDIDGEEAGDRFGCSVSLSASGNRLAVGAFFNDAGHVRIFSENAGVWSQVGGNIDGEAEGDWSGNSISLSAAGNRVAIGAEKNYGSGIPSGHVRVYAESGGTWAQEGDDIDGEATGDRSGYSVSLSASGLRVAIGAPGFDLPESNAGPVRVYEETTCDADMDGYDDTACGGLDCDDNDASVNPDATEVCNGMDDNCDGTVDEGNTDTDGDGVCDGLDNCPANANADQADADGDGMGDACDACPYDADNDSDSDGICGELDNCPSNANSGQEDSDCDGVGDACDVCPDGDDSVDNNNDGISDCSQLLNYAHYSSSWKCGNNKIYVCHDGTTTCISKNQLSSHYNHGDNIGPCVSCSESVMMPESTHAFIDDDIGVLTVYPNPAHSEATFRLNSFEHEGVELMLFDYSGKAVWQTRLEEGQHELKVDLSGNGFVSGVYFVKVSSSSNVLTERLVISKL